MPPANTKAVAGDGTGQHPELQEIHVQAQRQGGSRRCRGPPEGPPRGGAPVGGGLLLLDSHTPGSRGQPTLPTGDGGPRPPSRAVVERGCGSTHGRECLACCCLPGVGGVGTRPVRGNAGGMHGVWMYVHTVQHGDVRLMRMPRWAGCLGGRRPGSGAEVSTVQCWGASRSRVADKTRGGGVSRYGPQRAAAAARPPSAAALAPISYVL